MMARLLLHVTRNASLRSLAVFEAEDQMVCREQCGNDLAEDCRRACASHSHIESKDEQGSVSC